MNRKQFIESIGGTCANWTWSWSFINEAERFVVFGAWDAVTEGDRTEILNEDWEISRAGRKQAAYRYSREHIRLVEEEGFELKTFPMIRGSYNPDDPTSPAKIKGFTPELTTKTLLRIGKSWYASDGAPINRISEELEPHEVLVEGAANTVSVNSYERNPEARRKCLEHYGFKCLVCNFDFEKRYGSIGSQYIHVHHLVPIAEIGREYEVDPVNDLIPICPNCHAMVHSTRPAMAIEQIKKYIEENGEYT